MDLLNYSHPFMIGPSVGFGWDQLLCTDRNDASSVRRILKIGLAVLDDMLVVVRRYWSRHPTRGKHRSYFQIQGEPERMIREDTEA